MPIHFERTRDNLQRFDFRTLFIEELGWSRPARKTPLEIGVKERRFTGTHVAELGGAVVVEIESPEGTIPDAKTRAAVHKEVARLHHENLLIFVDRERTQSLWYWVKRQDGKQFPRDHLFCRGQPGDLFLSKLGGIVFDLSDFDAEGNVPVVEVAARLRAALDVEKVTKKFYGEFQEQHLAFLELIQGIDNERDRRWYASILLNRLMFIYFLQKKRFLDNANLDYLWDKLAWSKEQGRNKYFSDFLRPLFFEGFAKPEEQRSAADRKTLGQIPYLNGGLFLPHRLEDPEKYPKLNVPDKAFENLLDLFGRYSWNLNDAPGGADNEINPDVLGYIFEKYINQKAFGAYYTRPEITEYLCERTIHRLVLDGVNTPAAAPLPAGVKPRNYQSLADLLLDLDAQLCNRLLFDILPGLSLLDPACGSGAFLVAAMKTLINVYSAVIGKIKFLADRKLSQWLAGVEREHKSVHYYIKKKIITDNLYGVDLMEEATEIARLRLFLALVAAAEHVDQLEPLPNIDFNILSGNSLVGLMRVDGASFEEHDATRHPEPSAAVQQKLFAKNPKRFQGNLFRKKYSQVLAEKNALIDSYRNASSYTRDLAALRKEIDDKKREARETLDDILLDEFEALGIKYQQATWDDKKNDEGKPVKRPLAPGDISALTPFHWGFEFDKIINERGGFDAIITNPPWEVFKPNSKEFFEDHSELVSKKKMTIQDFEKEQAKLLRDAEVRTAWLAYLSGFPHVSAYYRSAAQFKNQISIVNGKKAGTDINLYKLFFEQCFNLMRSGANCGIIVPGSLYGDLGAKQLREVLFSQCQLDALFGLSNERYIFEGVEHRQKICILSFCKGGKTEVFSAAFRINPREAIRPEELEEFLHASSSHLRLDVSTIRKLSPDSIAVPELKVSLDLDISKRATRFPRLSERMPDSWNVQFVHEFHMTNDSHLFKKSLCDGRLPLFEGKMIQQFESQHAQPKYWLDEIEARASLLGKSADDGQELDYQNYRLGFRDVARNTDARTAIMTMLPRNVFCNHKLPTTLVTVGHENAFDCASALVFCALMNSLIVDFLVRQRVTANLTFIVLYQIPMPRVNNRDAEFGRIVDRAARLICTRPEFDALAKGVGLKSHKQGATDFAERARLRAELDGLVAHLYGLTEVEFAHVLSTFPLVPDPVKVAARNAYRDVARGLVK